MKKYTATTDCYYIAFSPSAHFASLKAGQEVLTGQQSLETFGSVDAWRDRLIELEFITEKHYFIDNEWRTLEGGLDVNGVKILEKDVTPELNIKNLRELNRDIRQGRVDYLIGAAEQLSSLASTVPEPYATDFIRASHSINVILSVYKQSIQDYIDTGSIGFESVIKNETNPIMLEILNLNVRPPDEVFPQGLTIKQSIIHQLTGVY